VGAEKEVNFEDSAKSEQKKTRGRRESFIRDRSFLPDPTKLLLLNLARRVGKTDRSFLKFYGEGIPVRGKLGTGENCGKDQDGKEVSGNDQDPPFLDKRKCSWIIRSAPGVLGKEKEQKGKQKKSEFLIRKTWVNHLHNER